jgi:hypothetical protein
LPENLVNGGECVKKSKISNLDFQEAKNPVIAMIIATVTTGELKKIDCTYPYLLLLLIGCVIGIT